MSVNIYKKCCVWIKYDCPHSARFLPLKGLHSSQLQGDLHIKVQDAHEIMWTVFKITCFRLGFLVSHLKQQVKAQNLRKKTCKNKWN